MHAVLIDALRGIINFPNAMRKMAESATDGRRLQQTTSVGLSRRLYRMDVATDKIRRVTYHPAMSFLNNRLRAAVNGNPLDGRSCVRGVIADYFELLRSVAPYTARRAPAAATSTAVRSIFVRKCELRERFKSAIE